MVSRVIRERELLHVRETTDRLAAAQQRLHALRDDPDEAAQSPSGADGAADGADTADAASQSTLLVLLARITALQQLGQVGQGLIEQLLSGRTVDVVGLQTALNLVVALDGAAPTDD
jgi:hypothetical protein